MKYSKISLASALALPLGILAQDCETSEPTLRVSSPGDLDVFRDGCSTITGNILIESGYSGDFVLEGVTDFKGNISTDGEAPAEDLGSFEMPDLEHIDVLNLLQVASVQLPSLEHGGNLVLVQSGSDGEVDLGSLVDVDNLALRGGWKSTVLKSLTTVNSDIEFCSVRDCGIFPDIDTPSMVVDLPVLESVKYLMVEGSVTSISVPHLKIAGVEDPDRPYSQGLRINVQGDPIDVDVPELHTMATQLEVYGSVSSISLGALGNTSIGLNFNTDTPLDIYSTLETASYGYFWGKVRSVNLPNLVHMGSVSIASDILPCNETLVKLWAMIPKFGPEQLHRCTAADLPDDDDDENTDPDDEVTPPDDEDTDPDDEDNGPYDEDTGPDDEDNGPDDEDNGPDDEDNGPDDEDNGPDDEDNGPDDEDTTPDEEDITPDEEDTTPDDEDTTPDEEDTTLDEEDTIPDEEDTTPDEDTSEDDTNSGDDSTDDSSTGPIFQGSASQTLPYAGKIAMVVVGVISAYYY